MEIIQIWKIFFSLHVNKYPDNSFRLVYHFTTFEYMYLYDILSDYVYLKKN